MPNDRFHGRFSGAGRTCDWAGCEEPGEFRAPGGGPTAGFDGPGNYRWFCLDHVRAFNAHYDFFKGMSSEQILDAQSPLYGWSTETRAFRPNASMDSAPRWADFTDPLDAIAARARWRAAEQKRAQNPPQRDDGMVLTPDERRALEALGLSVDADRRDLRRRYSELVRLYHPDRNGGDRSHEAKLQQVVEGYQLLRKAAAFS